MAIEVLAPLIIVAGATILILLERLFPYDRGQPLFRDGFWIDLLWYSLLQSYLLSLVIAAIIRFVDEHVGASPLRFVSGWSPLAQLLFFFVLHDFYIYWFHRLQHRSRILWRIHEAHHTVVDVDWLAGSRSHALEILINQTIEFLPMVILGARPEVPILKGVVDALWGMYIHSNINVRSGSLQYVINGPEMHRWHHAREVTEGGINFGTKLAVWDWLFGTAQLPRTKPGGYGLLGISFPKEVIGQLLFAFRPFSEEPSTQPLLTETDGTRMPGEKGRSQ